jgi:hypothetical protein
VFSLLFEKSKDGPMIKLFLFYFVLPHLIPGGWLIFTIIWITAFTLLPAEEQPDFTASLRMLRLLPAQVST